MKENKFFESIKIEDKYFENHNIEDYAMPLYDPKNHYLDISNSKYFKALIFFRHYIKKASDFYWTEIQNAYNIDLFMMTPSVSSPIGLGSDSEIIPIKFGDLDTFLVDSSQFGFEPILMSGIEKAYCYLPSMRGEMPDKRHLNQFYHCEAEIIGPINKLIPQITDYVKFLSKTILYMGNLVKILSIDSKKTIEILQQITNQKEFIEIEFDDAIKLLNDNGFSSLVNNTDTGRDITSLGEQKITELMQINTPIWIKNYDRDRVAFYQKPNENNKNRVINADLIFPQIINGSFGGEIVGCGERQDNQNEMYESLKRQNIDPEPYEWYINLRRQPGYKTTSGFGLGIERFIAWCLCKEDIKDVILYPRLKNILSYP